MENSLILVETIDETAIVSFNRAEKRNAFNLEMWRILYDIVQICEKDNRIKVVIFKGIDSTSFAAGADISEFKTHRYTAEGASSYNKIAMAAEHAVRQLSKPTIALIQGYCVGGGMEIALACDFRFSDPSGKFGITPAKLGLVYNTPGTKDLLELVGPSKTKDILFTGRLLDAAESYQIGLIDRIYESNEIDVMTRQYAETICINAQMSVRGAKLSIKKILQGNNEDDEELSQMILASFESEDYKEGVQAFLERRKPFFKYS